MASEMKGTLRIIGDDILITHSLFSIPFALSILLLQSDGTPSLGILFWVLVAVLAARNGANALNRVVDHQIDAKNPRTLGRALPSGRLSRTSLIVFTGCCGIALIIATASLNPLCIALLPVAIGLIGIYSYTKRFTWLCHGILGITVAAAPMGASIAVTGRFTLSGMILAAAVTLWVTGFDILYACQDRDFDERESLRSVPQRFGIEAALWITRVLHTGTALLLLSLKWSFPEVLGWSYILSVGIIIILLIRENTMITPKALTRIPTAAYTLNQMIGIVFLTGTLLDIYIFL